MRSAGKRASDSKGFTILEVLVAVTIVATIFTLVFATLFYTVNNAEEQEQRAALYHKAGFILNNIAQNASSAYIPFAGHITEEENEQSIFMGTDALDGGSPVDSLSMFTTNPRFGASALAGEIAYVSYQLAVDDTGAFAFAEDANNPFALQCTAAPLFSGQAEGAGGPQWKMNVRALNFEYFDGETWAGEWIYEEAEALPAAIKVNLEMADSSGRAHTFSTIAYIPVNTTLEEIGSEEQQQAQEGEEEEEQGETDEDQGEHDDEQQEGEAGQPGQQSGKTPFFEIVAPHGKPKTFDELIRQKR